MKPTALERSATLTHSNRPACRVASVQRWKFLATLGAVIVGLVIADSSSASSQTVLSGMIGRWQGDAHVIVVWCQQTNLPVNLNIQADGTVSGKIGNAALTNGRLRRNRGWLGRKLHIKTDYIITGGLSGPIVPAEHITRSGVKMPLSFRSGNFTGCIHTTGCKFGGKKRGILTAGFTLARTADP
jgi:hypothetical protein